MLNYQQQSGWTFEEKNRMEVKIGRSFSVQN